MIARNSVFRYKGKEDDLWRGTGVGRARGGRGACIAAWRESDGQCGVGGRGENRQIWGQQYNRKLADVFAVQEEIAQEIAEKLRLKLTGAERQQLGKRPTENLKAFQYYMQGRAYANRRTREDLLTAIRYCEKAIEEDQQLCARLRGLSRRLVALGVRGYIAPSKAVARAEEAARRPSRSMKTWPKLIVALGEVYTHFAPYNFSRGDRELRRAIRTQPESGPGPSLLGIFARATGASR